LMPALLTRISIRPNSFITLLTISSISSLLETSPLLKIAFPPFSIISPQTSSSLSAVLPVIATFAPSFANRSAVSLPIPLPAPVIIATLFSSLVLFHL